MKTVLALIIGAYCMSLGACMFRHNDGAGDLYKVIQYCRQGNC